jgi:hypothetical protein
MEHTYATPKQALDAILASNSAAKTADILDIHRANIFHYLHRYNKKHVPPIVKQALIDKGYITKRKRIRSQINWETEEQKQAFLQHVHTMGFPSVTEYARNKANAALDGRLYDGFISWNHVDYHGELFEFSVSDIKERTDANIQQP